MAESEIPIAPMPSPEANTNGAATPVELRPTTAKRPKKPLPTNRIAFLKQLDLLRAFDAAAGGLSKPVSLADVAKIAKISPPTISLNNSFFVDAGLLNKADGGRLIPSVAVHEFVMAYQWAPATAAQKLAPALTQSWFFKTLESRLRYQPMQEHEAQVLLATTAEASKEYGPQILVLLNYLQVAGLIERDGATIKLARRHPADVEAPAETPALQQLEPENEIAPETAGSTRAGRTSQASSVASGFTQQPEGALTFHVSVRVEMSEMKDWRPERIAALFAGVAQVLAAKADIERDAAT